MVLFFPLIITSLKSAFLSSADLSKESLVEEKNKQTQNLCEGLAFSTLKIIQAFDMGQTTYLVVINNKVCVCVCIL